MPPPSQTTPKPKWTAFIKVERGSIPSKETNLAHGPSCPALGPDFAVT